MTEAQSMLDELHTLMNFLPVTHNQQAVGALLDHVEARLHQCGLSVERLEHAGVQSLYASTRGQKHSRVMLQAHIDVVPGGEPFRLRGDRIYGRGCYDMLFAVASFLQLIDNLENPAAYDLSILLTGDEEVGGKNGIGTILDVEQYTCDVCVLPDAGEGLGTLSTAAKGIYDLRVKANGASHHGSRPWEGDNAAHKLIAFLTDLQAEFDTSTRDNSTITVSQLQAGNEALNQGPAEAFGGIDIRYTSQAEYKRLRTALEKLAARHDVEVLEEEYGRNFSLDTTNKLVQRFIDLQQASVGQPIAFITAHGSSDARFFDDKGMPVIMLRPDGGNAHGDGEWLSLSSWQQFHEILEAYVLEVAKI